MHARIRLSFLKTVKVMSKETLDYGLGLLRMGSTESTQSMEDAIKAGVVHACMLDIYVACWQEKMKKIQNMQKELAEVEKASTGTPSPPPIAVPGVVFICYKCMHGFTHKVQVSDTMLPRLAFMLLEFHLAGWSAAILRQRPSGCWAQLQHAAHA